MSAARARVLLRSGNAAGALLRFSSVSLFIQLHLRSPLLLLGTPASSAQSVFLLFFFFPSSEMYLPAFTLFSGDVVQCCLILLDSSSPCQLIPTDRRGLRAGHVLL